MLVVCREITLFYILVVIDWRLSLSIDSIAHIICVVKETNGSETNSNRGRLWCCASFWDSWFEKLNIDSLLFENRENQVHEKCSDHGIKKNSCRILLWLYVCFIPKYFHYFRSHCTFLFLSNSELICPKFYTFFSLSYFSLTPIHRFLTFNLCWTMYFLFSLSLSQSRFLDFLLVCWFYFSLSLVFFFF